MDNGREDWIFMQAIKASLQPLFGPRVSIDVIGKRWLAIAWGPYRIKIFHTDGQQLVFASLGIKEATYNNPDSYTEHPLSQSNGVIVAIDAVCLSDHNTIAVEIASPKCIQDIAKITKLILAKCATHRPEKCHEIFTLEP